MLFLRAKRESPSVLFYPSGAVRVSLHQQKEVAWRVFVKSGAEGQKSCTNSASQRCVACGNRGRLGMKMASTIILILSATSLLLHR